ncbi:hypothetical protein [Sphingobacterium faecium]|uniref:hypothetical protein n=1 Tax=Sphingobacterium faecium TaxID=34087 RepID=UPI003207F88E
MNKYVRLLSLITVFTVGLFVASCSKDKDDHQPIPAALFTMINGYSGAKAVIYYADGNILQNPNFPLLYKSQSKVGLFPGSRKITITSRDGNLIDSTIVVKDSTIYSSFLYGSKLKPAQAITTDRVNKEIKKTESGLRFFNFYEGSDQVTLHIGDQAAPAAWTDRAKETQQSVTAHESFIAQKSGTFTVVAKNKAGKTLASRENIKLAENHYYSFILIGDPAQDSQSVYLGLVEQHAN